jgi:hypothetical protein
MSITGLPGQGPVRVGIPIADLRRTVLRDGHSDRAVGAREIRKGQWVSDLAAAGADLHARFPGRALADAGRSRQTGRQQSSDQHSDRRVQDQDGYINIATTGQKIWEIACRSLGARADRPRPEYKTGAAALQEPRRAQCRDRSQDCSQYQRGMGRHFQQGRRAVRADLYHRSDCSPTSRSSISASRKTPPSRTASSRPLSVSRSRCRARRARLSRRRLRSASTPMKCLRNSASPIRKSPSCTP